jgi:hypothetical protein
VLEFVPLKSLCFRQRLINKCKLRSDRRDRRTFKAGRNNGKVLKELPVYASTPLTVVRRRRSLQEQQTVLSGDFLAGRSFSFMYL